MIKVLQTGFYSSIQDLGRFDSLELGVPISGAMDQISSSLANALLQNPANAAVMEITMTGPVLQFISNIEFIVTGADMVAKLNDKQIPINTILKGKVNDVLSFGRLKSGFRSYLGVKGGFDTENILGSRSMYHKVTKQSCIEKNDLLKISGIFANQFRQEKLRIRGTTSDHLRPLMAYKGPEYDLLRADQKSWLASETFTISSSNNRMGYQLNELLENDLPSIITSPVMPGTVQLTPSGTLIILMRDCQTTGGYPRVLQLSEQAINQLSQKYTGNSLQFKVIDN